uniref:Regulator of microtubule dynamics protein 1 n=1 Tax=Eptatretus burgeri TaxID=7764 RepID=A0A8C4QYR2_EPTBU
MAGRLVTWPVRRWFVRVSGGRARPRFSRGTQVAALCTTAQVSLLGLGGITWFHQWPHTAACLSKEMEVDEIIERADYLYGTSETEKLYKFLIEYSDSTNDEVLWRLARASRDLAQLSGTPVEERRRLAYEALEFSKQALDGNPRNFACHKWYAICISDVGDFEGTKAKIANAYIIREHFQKAIELNTNDATSVHLMGLWCYTFAEMPWYQHRIASVLFATPPSSTFEEALQYFTRAEKVEPNFYSKNLLMLGKTLLKLGNQKYALLWLTKAQQFPARTEEDRQVQKEAAELLKDAIRKR